MRRIAWCLAGWLLAFAATGQDSNISQGDLSTALIESAIAQAESNSELSEESRAQLIETYRRAQGFLESEQVQRERLRQYESARQTAADEAAEIQKFLETEMAERQAVTPPDPDLSLQELEAVIQRDESSIDTAETRLTDLENRLEREAGRARAIRARLTEVKQSLNELSDQVDSSGTAQSGGQAPSSRARQWLYEAQLRALRAESAALEHELLSQPMRLELLKAQREQARFDLRRLRERAKLYTQRAIKLRQGVAAKVQSEAQDAAAVAQAEGKHPVIVALADRNASLSKQIAARTSELEKISGEESVANETAARLESELQAMERKLEVLGMSQALGRVLREQRLRLPENTFSRADTAARDALIGESSLRQFEYEDERHQLRNTREYVSDLVAGLPEAEAAAIREDLVTLARTRRDMIKRAIDVESAYLRALGELDFAARRLNNANSAYREFISERLLWIRTSDALSLSAFKPLPGEIAHALSPGNWADTAMAFGRHLLDAPLYGLLLLAGAVLLRYQRRLMAALAATGEPVGNVETDRMMFTVKGLGLTLLVALPLPLLLLAVGLVLQHGGERGSFESAIGVAAERISLYFFGLQFLRVLLADRGLVRRHFGWKRAMVAALALHLRRLAVVFLPFAFGAAMANQLSRGDADSALASLMLVVALAAFARFYAGFPDLLQGPLDRLVKPAGRQRVALWVRMLRYLMIIIPCLLIIALVLGYRHTATEFLVLLVLTNALLAGLLLVHELGIRWLKILRRRIVQREYEAARKAALEQRPEDDLDEADKLAALAEEPAPDDLDDEGSKLLNVILAVVGIAGIWAVWVDVLPALGILDSVELWHTSDIVDGVETPTAVTLVDVGFALLVGFLGYVASRRVPALLEILLRNKMAISSGNVYAGVTLFQYGLVTLVVVAVLNMLGANWSQIQWAVAALSVGIGFGLQEIVANFISGLILLFEQPIRVGDTVTVGETSGVVTRIRMRATTIRDWDRRELLVPNKEFITGRLLNWSLSDKVTRVVVLVGVSYGTDVRRAMALCHEAVREHPEVIEDPKPLITFDEFGDNALQIVVRCYLSDMDSRLVVASELRAAINDKFNEEGIVIAFPQRDVHLDTSSPLEVTINNLDGRVPAE